MSEIPKPAWTGWSSNWFSLFSYEIGGMELIPGQHIGLQPAITLR